MGLPWPVLGGAALLFAVTWLAYLPSMRGGFILDDNVLVTDSALIRAPDGLYRFWLTSEPIDYWPVSNTSFWIEWRLWGMNPTGYHVTNLVLHVASALLLWAVLARLSIPGAFLAAMLFALHPVNVESVAWITQRKNLLAIVFSLLSTLCYLASETRSPASTRWYGASLAAFVLALLSKGSIVVLPILLLTIVWWQRPLARRDLVRVVPFLLAGAILSLVNVGFQARFHQPDGGAPALIERVLGAGAVVWFYLYKALLPVGLCFVYPKWHIETGQPRWWLPLLACLAATGALWLYQRRWSRPVLFAWIVFCVSLAPAMGFTDVGFMKHSMVADHYQHLAIIAVVALAAAAWGTLEKQARGSARGIPRATALAAVGVLAVLTWRQSALYADATTLFGATVEKNPGSPFARNNYGLALLDGARPAEASAQFEAAVRLEPRYPEAHYNLARTLLRKDRLEEALEHYRLAAEQSPRSPAYQYDLANALARARRLDEAAEHFRQALLLQPDNPEADNNLGGVLFEIGKVDEAIEHYRQSLRSAPDFPEAHSNLGRALFQTGRSSEAIEHFEQAARLKPDSAGAQNDLGAALAEAGRLAEAVEHFRRALELDPKNRNARSNLDEVLAKQGTAAEPTK